MPKIRLHVRHRNDMLILPELRALIEMMRRFQSDFVVERMVYDAKKKATEKFNQGRIFVWDGATPLPMDRIGTYQTILNLDDLKMYQVAALPLGLAQPIKPS